MSKFSFKERAKSFVYAFEGLIQLVKGEHNFWIHLTVATFTSLLGFYLNISNIEWSIVIICFGVVLAAEGFNSAIEVLANKVTLEHDELIKKCKDIAAASVLITSIMAFVVGIIIFIPKII